MSQQPPPQSPPPDWWLDEDEDEAVLFITFTKTGTYLGQRLQFCLEKTLSDSYLKTIERS
ncbi:hypothetical protein AAY473_031013 [Plecturocebus cupreus]